MIENIVVAVDSSAAAVRAFEWAKQLAAHASDIEGANPHLTLVNVMAAAGDLSDPLSRFHSHLDAQNAEALLHSFAETVETRYETEELAIFSEDTVGAIVGVARDHNADIIATGTAGGGAIRQALFGSLAQQLADHPAVVTAVIPEGAPISTNLTVVGYDGSKESRAGIRWALAHTTGEIRVIRVVGSEEESIEARESIAALLPGLGHDAIGRVQAEVVVGDPVSVLIEPAQATPQLVVGAGISKGDSIWGSTTAHVIAESPYPVVVVPDDNDLGWGNPT